MSLNEALFLVDRAGSNYHCQGQDLYTRVRPTDKVLVQRGADHYIAWRSQPSASDTPYMTRRFNYLVEVDGDGNRQHPDGDGKINLSLDFGTPGPYPTEEWRNLRNKQKNLNDLDGEPFVLQNNPDVADGDIVRITEEGGPFAGWYEIENDTNSWVRFQEQYQREDGRTRTDISKTGPRPPWDGTAVLRFDFFRPDPDQPFGTIRDDDLLLVWERNASRKVTGASFKELLSFDFDQCRIDARVEYLACVAGCESQYCTDSCYDPLYINNLKLCYDKAGQPYPPTWPPPIGG